MHIQPNQTISEDISLLRAQPILWNRFHKKRILVSGAAGFLPAYLVELLHSLGENGGPDCHIIGLVRNREKAEKRFAHLKTSPRFSLLVQDVCSPVQCEQKIDFVIHAASQASPRFYGKDPLGTFAANVFGTENLLELAHRNEVESFLFFSSGEVYGQVAPENMPIKETDYGYLDPSQVRSCYAEGKRAGETLCTCWHEQHGLPVRIVRPFHTYGPGMALDDGRVFADFVANVVAGRNIILKSDGCARRAFCYLADATAAFIKVLLDGEAVKPYNVGNPDAEVSVFELAELIVEIARELLPESILNVVRSETGHGAGYLQSQITSYAPDVSAISKLGWRPTTSLRKGFTRTIQSYL